MWCGTSLVLELRKSEPAKRSLVIYRGRSGWRPECCRRRWQFYFFSVAIVQRCATCSGECHKYCRALDWPGFQRWRIPAAFECSDASRVSAAGGQPGRRNCRSNPFVTDTGAHFHAGAAVADAIGNSAVYFWSENLSSQRCIGKPRGKHACHFLGFILPLTGGNLWRLFWLRDGNCDPGHAHGLRHG